MQDCLAETVFFATFAGGWKQFGIKMEQNNYPYPPQRPRRRGNGMLWLLLSIMLASLLLLGASFFFWYSRQGKGGVTESERTEENTKETASALLADGSYIYEGVWDDGGSDPQPCQISFTKASGRLMDCSYTNLRWSTTIRLSGEERGETLRFTGKIGNEDLIITVAPEKGDLKMLTGTGIDYAHQGVSKVLKLYALIEPDALGAAIPQSSAPERIREGGAGQSITGNAEKVMVVNAAELADIASPSMSEKPKEDDSKVFDVVEQMPSFPGGNVMAWLSQNIKYPVVAAENGVHGRVVVQFVVEKDGSVSDVHAVKKVDPSLDKEAERVVKSMPRWNPGRQNGSPVRVKYTLPLTFKLE